MIEPSIEALLKCTDNNKYKLCILAEKRAKEIANKIYYEGTPSNPADKKEISKALDEIVEKKVTMNED